MFLNEDEWLKKDFETIKPSEFCFCKSRLSGENRRWWIRRSCRQPEGRNNDSKLFALESLKCPTDHFSRICPTFFYRCPPFFHHFGKLPQRWKACVMGPREGRPSRQELFFVWSKVGGLWRKKRVPFLMVWQLKIVTLNFIFLFCWWTNWIDCEDVWDPGDVALAGRWTKTRFRTKPADQGSRERGAHKSAGATGALGNTKEPPKTRKNAVTF